MSQLSVDGGQTGSRLRLRRDDGSHSDHDARPILTDRPVLPQVVALAEELLTSTGDTVECIAVGLSGLTADAQRPDALLDAATHLGVRRVALAHDSVTAFLAANRDHHGVVVAAGTGVVTLAVATGVARVDGWGYLFGDAGSAFWIGRAGVDAALRAHDGRGESTVLRDAAAERFGEMSELYMRVQADPGRVSAVAGFARTVAEVADGGDAVAERIIDDAAAALTESVVAGSRRAGWSTGHELRVSWVGKVLGSNRRLRSRFVELVIAALPEAAVEPPIGKTLDGVELLSEVDPRSPLRRLIAQAGADSAG
ncbi:N-acetylglucosamine kinase [Williamsia sterculiae]|uniref:BadF-type ATPase n=1 Tax=Williamsia sterculiae TaxID=1344003 RepID=A0A1N7EZP6_9NOCA|nr:BadF/BadG/BcrA/BcrD ATPase family protein [Williamsia sterculiae]SIR93537.1 BadF-type ATPase [Williamsia sterculiae]